MKNLTTSFLVIATLIGAQSTTRAAGKAISRQPAITILGATYRHEQKNPRQEDDGDGSYYTRWDEHDVGHIRMRGTPAATTRFISRLTSPYRSQLFGIKVVKRNVVDVKFKVDTKYQIYTSPSRTHTTQLSGSIVINRAYNLASAMRARK